MKQLFDPAEFPQVKADTDQVLDDLAQKARNAAKKIYETRDRMRKELPVLMEMVNKATVPSEAEVRLSASEFGQFTFTVSNLESFHDITELTAALQPLRKIWKHTATDDNWSDYPAEKKRVFSFSDQGWYKDVQENTGISSTVRVVAILDEERGQCKITSGPVERHTYTSETIKQEIVCPGDPRYDDL